MRPSLRLALPLMIAAAACGGDDDADLDAEARPVVERHAEDARQAYAAALTAAQAMDAAIDAFVKAPTAATLDAAKQAWIAARVPYRLTEAYRFYGGPIDDVEDKINAWPLDEAYIDYVVDGTKLMEVGVINNTQAFPLIDAKTLTEINFKDGESNVSTGFHAIEFLLWGQDKSTSGPGARPHTDFVDGGTAKNADRRRDYLTVVTDQLIADLTHVVEGWAEGAEYRAAFVGAPTRSLALILTGVGTLSASELSGERMLAAYKDSDQELEHSCFSDTTLDDLIGNAISLEDLYLGRAGVVDGAGVDDVVKAHDPALDTKMKEQLTAAIAAVKAIPGPFDQAIVDTKPDGTDGPKRAAVLAAVRAVQDVGDTVIAIADKLDLTIKTELE